MEQHDIIIEDLNITEFYNDLLEKRIKIRKGASEIIADNIKLAQSFTKQLLESQDLEEIKTLAKNAYQALETTNIVSEVSGVHFYLPYSSNYDNADIFGRILDNYNFEDDSLLKDLPEIAKLQQLFENLEYKSGQWNASFC